MLTQLSIRNYALIEDLQVSFSKGFTTITGETGAGKSILLEGLGLVLGNRADRSALRDDQNHCVVEAEFEISSYPAIREYFTREDLDYDPQTLLRREIRPNGKSRAFINDSPVTLDVLAGLGRLLIDVHSQHQTLELTEHDFQMRVVDALAENRELLGRYGEVRREYQETSRELEQLRERRQAAFREQDYNEFLLEELEQANLSPDLQETLEARQSELSNAGQIAEYLEASYQLCEAEEHGLQALQARLKQLTGKLTSLAPKYAELHARVQSLFIETDDITQEFGALVSEVESDPAALDTVNGRLQTLYDLQHKHHVGDVQGLIEVRDALARQVSDTASMDEAIERLEARVTEQEATLHALALQLRERREQVLPQFTAQLGEQLARLGMPHASFRWLLHQRDDFGPLGRDLLELQFTANKGGQYGILKKTASGGELSRIMLVIKAILARYEALPTMMFDEIDTGVSGEISNRMGEIMLEMSRHMQVFAITHLPQVASKGHQQFQVYKEVGADQTRTGMKPLTREERIQELAQMLGGTQISAAALSHARELLN
ncbi:DNA repair protein RecN [Robiginitalea sp. M366]|uniref:DNA repair protein RecN n=1 Tax=Robiginitalea aestuariiviva TaxID=3036903 RepID=UPI00240D630A|nr:DNA repair protein RecN [Robiginitalea aestuariiviva]MDG1573132.1 DNA repair protein RecN [Robiginitalea aestuariiviva]